MLQAGRAAPYVARQHLGAGADASRPPIARIAEHSRGRNCLPSTQKWIGRCDRPDVKLLLRSWLFNAIARIGRPTLTFTNQHRSYYRLLAGGSGFGYMRDGQKKKKHECCAAHFSFISTNILSTTPGTKNVSVGHALLIWFIEWPHENQTLNKFRG